MKELPLDDKIGGTYMPLINITLGATTEEQKKEIIEKVTRTMVDITKIPEDKFMTLIHELPYENLGLGTKTVKDLLNQ